jgi:thiol-disulfide isomerase/thioredoxin
MQSSPEAGLRGKLLIGAVIGVVLIRAFGSHWRMPAVSLPTHRSGEEVALNECPTAKCLTVYLAPWCPHCRGSSQLVRAVRGDMLKRGITTRIVVGMDQRPALENFAEEFGPGTLIDEKGQFKVGGVPAVYVSDNRGSILKHMTGLPEIHPPEDPAQMRGIESRFFGLP